MKELNLYKIRDMALKSKRAVFTVQQLANLIRKPKPIANVYFSRLVKKDLAKRLERGKISFIEDDYIIATQFLEPSYISLTSALLFHGLITQVPKNVECITPKNSRRYPALGLVYHRIPPSFFYGYERHSKAESYILIADPEKALLDSIYFSCIPKSTIKEILEKVDHEKLESYVNRFNRRGRKKLERWIK